MLDTFAKIRQPKYILKVLILCLFFFVVSLLDTSYIQLLTSHKGFAFYTTTYEDKLSCIFQIGRKLVGNGEVKLSIDEDKTIKGIATGIGRASGCEVVFQTNFVGALGRSRRSIEVNIIGEGKPRGVLFGRGKISFQGPLEGYLQDKKLLLAGEVYINGKLARYAGFKEKEMLLIEIPGDLDQKVH